MAQMVYLLNRAFKAAIINISKGLKEHLVIMSECVGHFDREIETKKIKRKVLEWKS